MRFLIFLKKEILLLSRDLHALLLLFLMPTLFILIMSLAMQNTFSTHNEVKISYLLVDDDRGAYATWLIDRFERGQNFQRFIPESRQVDAQKLLRSDDIKFMLTIPIGFSAALESDPSTIPPLLVQAAPSTQQPIALLFESWVRENIGELFLKVAEENGVLTEDVIDAELIRATVKRDPGNAAEDHIIPTSVQQNVPAWLVFSMFFIAIPVSTTFLGERAHGTLDRLNTMSVSRWQFLASKLVTYVGINLVQVVLLFAVGIWVVPMFGGDALTVGKSPAGLALIALAISFASVSFALLIANLVSTTEQATILAGVSNIILAAIGGVMVPRFVMPATMQKFSLMSPHAWGLEGFLDIILRGGGVADVLPEAGFLATFGLAMLLISARLMKRH